MLFKPNHKPTTTNMPISFTVNPRPIKDLLVGTPGSNGEVKNDAFVNIPIHQRPEIWDVSKKQRLVRTVLDGRPMPTLTIREATENGLRIRWLEDGQQRYWSLKRYTEDVFVAELPDGSNKKYSELSPAEKAAFDHYPVFIMTYEGATEKQKYEMFQDLQESKPLTTGQRFHAMTEMSPIVRYAKESFLYGASPLAHRCRAIFGLPDAPKDTKTMTLLQNAMAIAGGLCISPDFITTSYDYMGKHLIEPVPHTASSALERLLNIYESVEAISPWSKKTRRDYYWPLGKLTGYVLWSITVCQRAGGNMDKLSAGWINYLLSVHTNRALLANLTYNKPSSRNWNSERWEVGFSNIFDGEPANPTLKVITAAVNDDPSDSDTDDDESNA
jgi:hypothetical protein